MSPTEIHFRIEGNPTSKGRPRFSSRGGFARTYTDAKTRVAESNFRAQAIKYKPITPLTKALKLSLTFSLIKPKSKPKRVSYCITRPDLDNYIKLAEDALNMIFWIDDSQVVEISAKKVYGDSAFTHVGITPLEEEDGN